MLTVDGELRKTRLFRSHEQAELVGAIADTRAMFERKGGREHRDDSERAELIGTSAPRAPLVGEGMLQRNNQLLGSCDPPTAVDIAYIRRTSTLAYRWQQAV